MTLLVNHHYCNSPPSVGERLDDVTFALFSPRPSLLLWKPMRFVSVVQQMLS